MSAHPDATWLAKSALFIWVIVSLVVSKRMRPPVAAAGLLVFGTLFLPERISFDYPLIPPFDKAKVITFWAFIGAFIYARPYFRRARFGRVPKVLWAILVIGAIGTTLENDDSLIYGPTILPEMTFNDTVSFVARDILFVIVPFYLGRALFSTARDLADLLRTFVAGATIYTLFALVELRLSPQFHNWVYGYGAHQFAQSARGEGWRPVVFLGHGLALALVNFIAIGASALLSRIGVRVFRLRSGVLTIYITAILALSKSVAATLYSLAAVPVLLWASPKAAVRIALVLAIVVLSWPGLRANESFPSETLVEWGNAISLERGESLWFRFYHEERLLAKGREQITFGWGGYGRSRIYHSESGEDTSVTDGYWIVRLCERGLFGFIGEFGFLLFPVFAAFRRVRDLPPAEARLVGGTTLILAICTLDLLPNGMFTFFPFVLSGALMGLTDREALRRRARATPQSSEQRARPGEQPAPVASRVRTT